MWWHLSIISELWNIMSEDVLGYIGSLKTTWAKWEPILKRKKLYLSSYKERFKILRRDAKKPRIGPIEYEKVWSFKGCEIQTWYQCWT